MSSPPSNLKIYHITHIDNFGDIIVKDGLLSDAVMNQRGGPHRNIGMSTIKRRRLYELEIPCHPGTRVGEYVPFYFCPRSVMLFVIHRGNHPELTFRDGQDPIIHLVANLYRVIEYADSNGVRWAFSLSNAGAYHTEFRNSIQDLDQLDWDAIFAEDFRHPDVKENKQAEFLLYEFFPFHLIELIGVRNQSVCKQALRVLRGCNHRPLVQVQPHWYF